MAFLSREELFKMGLLDIGDNVLISEKASIYGVDNIRIGSNVRIDDFCILSASGGIELGDFIHISCYTSLIGGGKITIKDYCSLSGRVSIYSSTDDYLGFGMANPMVPERYTHVRHMDVTLNKHCIVGCGSVIMPGVTLGEGCSVGALSFVNKSLPEYVVCRGTPAKVMITRTRRIIEANEKLLLKDVANYEV